MKGLQKETQKKRGHFPWKRAIAALVTSLLLSAAAILLILSTEHVIAAYWLVVIPSIFAVMVLLIPLYQWLFPISPEAPSNPSQSSSLAEPATRNEQAKQPTNIWNVPYQRNPFFTGREELLKQLHDNLTNRKAAALTQAISGLGGIGKTQTAVEYAFRYRNEYHDVLWVNAATRDTLIASFLDLAQRLNLVKKDEQDQKIAVQVTKQWLEQHDQWLLIFDNADDLALAEEFPPTGSKGYILLTTRVQAPGTLANGIDVNKMDPEEGMLLLLHRARVLAIDSPLDQAPAADCAAAESIVTEMDGLPLALDQAGAYIEETHCGVSAYLISYRQRQSELLKRRGGTGKEHPEPVATTWSLAFEQVDRLNSMAADLLRVCAFLAPDAIPEELFVEGASELGSHLQPLATDATRLHDAISILLRYSLVKRNPREHMLSIHRLVQAVLRDAMPLEIKKKWIKCAVQALNEVFPDIDDKRSMSFNERLLFHAQTTLAFSAKWSMEFVEAISLRNRVNSYERFTEILPDLPGQLRAVVVLRNYYDFSYIEIAQALNISEAEARKRWLHSYRFMKNKGVFNTPKDS